MNKRIFHRAHRRMVRQTFSPGFTSAHRTRRGYVESKQTYRFGAYGGLPAEIFFDDVERDKRKRGESHDSHGRRGRKPLTERRRYVLHLRKLRPS